MLMATAEVTAYQRYRRKWVQTTKGAREHLTGSTGTKDAFGALIASSEIPKGCARYLVIYLLNTVKVLSGMTRGGTEEVFCVGRLHQYRFLYAGQNQPPPTHSRDKMGGPTALSQSSPQHLPNK